MVIISGVPIFRIFTVFKNFIQVSHQPLFQQYLMKKNLPYFFGYETEFFSFQNNPKNLDPSYKPDLDLWDCSGRVNLAL